MQDYINCKNAAKEFINQYDGIVDKYLDWVEVTEENLSIIKETIDKITNE
jgi:hypothetical protein